MAEIYLTRRNRQKKGLEKLATIIPGGIMVEVGSYAGASTEIFASTNKFEVIHAIDSWKAGYDNSGKGQSAVLSNSNMEKVENVFDNIQIKYPCIRKIKNTSAKSVCGFADNSLDFVYIDACHKYESVFEDISIWLPKIKYTGWIGGHDFANSWPGVRQAVLDVLGTPHHLFIDSSWVIENPNRKNNPLIRPPHPIEITDIISS